MDSKSNYGVINEQGYVQGQLGFNEMTKEEHDKLLNENKTDNDDQSK